MKFRKKPIVIEAEQFFIDKPLPFQSRGPSAPMQFGCTCGEHGCCPLCGRFWVQTLEGPVVVSEGDWILCGLKGEIYPCKPDIFAQTHEAVDPVQTPSRPKERIIVGETTND